MTDNTPTTKQEEGGLVTVPREPTEAMLIAGAEAEDGVCSEDSEPYVRAAWSAMLAAAPATPPHNEDGLRKALEQSPTDEAFADAVWAALKGDHNDLRRQAIILRAHRAANAARQALGDIPSG